MTPPPLFRPCRWLLLLTSFSLGGCGLIGTVPEPAPVEEAVVPSPVVAPAPAPRDDGAALRAHLREHYKLWKGTPYRLGGLTTRGIDCSGFVLVTFKALLGTTLPRTVEAQAQLGQGIGPEQLETGDLVFFRTGGATRHVGIYLEQGRFLHASTRRGVMISRLGDGYWRHRYWQARRVRPAPPLAPAGPAVQSAGND
ncbi:MAG: NlpC/P60 family protein [Gammaproteobacteria bacterium]